LVPMLALLAALGLAQPAQASPSDCLWDAVGPTRRDAWLGQYVSDPGGLMKTTLPAELTAGLAATCEVPAGKVRDLLVARTVETGAEAWWDREMQKPGALARSWEALSEPERAQLRRWAATAIDDGNGDEVEMDGLPAFARGAGLQDPNGPGMMHVMGYMMGRGYRELAGDR
jgi:hypothetical protein